MAQATYFANLLLSDRCLEILLQIRRGGNDVLTVVKRYALAWGDDPQNALRCEKRCSQNRKKKNAKGIKYRRRTLFFQASSGLRNIAEDFTQDGVDRLLGGTLTCP